MPLDAAGPTLLLTSAGTSVLLDVTGGRLPSIVSWGPDLSGLDAEDAAALVLGSVPLVGNNNVDVPVRVSVLPELSVGWTGRPGLRGSRGRGMGTGTSAARRPGAMPARNIASHT